MLVFVDESGDTGMKVGEGSSERFTVALVVFEDNEEAQATDDRIGLLRRELAKPASFEFHFKENSYRIRQAFFEAIVPYDFYYFGFVINKSGLYGPGFRFKDVFYKYVCGMIFENAKPYLEEAIVKIDGSGNREFRQQLASYLRKRINDRDLPSKHIKKVATPSSAGNNLLQLADMVCGAIARSFRTDKDDADRFRKIIKHREISVRFWPE